MKKKEIAALFIFILSVYVLNAEAAQLACNMPSSGICSEFAGATWSAEELKASCPEKGANAKIKSCEKKNCIGMCVMAKGTKKETRVYYYKPIYQPEMVSMTCQMMGGEIVASCK